MDSYGDVAYDAAQRPGDSNLLDILNHCSDDRISTDANDFMEDVEGLSMRGLKERVSNAVEATLQPIRDRYHGLIADERGWKTLLPKVLSVQARAPQ